MLNKLLFHRFPKVKSWLTRIQYDLITRFDHGNEVLFMNFGYAPPEPIPLSPEEEYHRYPLQMYHKVASHIDWQNVEALEVSSGRGGGASFIVTHFKPRSYTGLDFSSKAVEFCRRQYAHLNELSFQCGNAEAIPFADESFDVVVNVEASLYYPNLMKFFEHVRRVLKPNGYFLYTDLRYDEKVAIWRAQIEAMGLKLVHEEDITDNVLRAMTLDRERRKALVDRYVPRILRRQFYHFAGLSMDDLAATPHLEKRRYWYFVLQKA
ncbi:phthiotriol/phenolphthiotriol dimycocerosates methyltransferase [Chloroflexota bacterium]